MIKKTQTELCLFTFILLVVLFNPSIDFEIFKFFSQFNYDPETNYLKDFFVGITDLGDSLWYFLLLVLIFFISYMLNISGKISLEKYYFLKKFSIFSFSYLLLVGFFTQTLKHLIGRPRPNYAKIDGGFDFNFLTTESAFHSFPSGHTSTIIAVTIIASLAVPNLKYFFYFCGFLISISRVVVKAHFLTDVIGGVLVAIIVYKFFNYFVNIKYPNIYWQNSKTDQTKLMTKIFIIFFVLGVFVTMGPEIDLFLSSFFYHGNNQFLLQSYYPVSIIFRKILLPFVLVYIFLLPIVLKFLPIQKIYFGYKFSISEIFFLWSSGIVTMLLVVNAVLKNMWGRARPNDVSYFGGAYDFAPWYKISDSCLSNCSFVSGDASVGFLLVVFYFITKKNIYLYLSLFFGFFLGFIRIIAGGHFFSDVIFSQIVVTFTLFASFILYKKIYDK